jgi:TPR repeat protein
MRLFDFLKKGKGGKTGSPKSVSDVVSELTGKRIMPGDPGYSSLISNMGMSKDSYLKEAEAGNGLAQYNLGVCFQKGYGTEIDYNQAILWFDKASHQGEIDALVCMGSCYYQGGYGIQRDFQKAFDYWEEAYKKGSADAAHNIGFHYETGDGVNKDMVKAVLWYTKAAKGGVAMSQYNLGICYYTGNGVEKSLEKAINWWEKAAGQGHKEAQHNVAVLKKK